MKGSTRKRGQTWYARLYVGRDHQGKPRYSEKGGFPTKRAAEQFLAEKITELSRNNYVAPSKESVEEYANRFLQEKQYQVREGTFRKYRWLVNKYIVPEIGNIELRKLRPEHIQDFYLRLLTEYHLSKTSVKHTHVLLSQILNQACKKGKLATNVALLVDSQKPDDIEMKTWSEHEVTKFLDAARSSRYYMVFALLLGTGMRLGEVLGLQWKDVDWQTGKVHVQRSFTHGMKGYVFQPPKTKKGNRAIKLAASTLADLHLHKIKQQEERQSAGDLWEENDLIIATELGRPTMPHNIRMAFNRIVNKSGVPRIRIHDLRHTHATLLLLKGIHPKVVSERLGHEDISITLRTYSHVLPVMQDEAAEKIDAVLSSSSQSAGKTAEIPYGQDMGKPF
ncbi:integrase family protein [Alicyclobacillus hesperidum URH17-3-68]|uniref:site-specific integrase n=1 Tax=Alicyclobacillus hesperidum TaxID=89784 RepID=UPI000281B8AD|nr:site-specific integrase [Alicyclobacillus hesperidum]EJY55883.1 integrase family protein [Alicyclobacillus hesperidum URH17-3-68]